MDLDFDKTFRMIPAVIQDLASGRVLMVVFMHRESPELAVQTGLTMPDDFAAHRALLELPPPATSQAVH